MHMLGRDLHTVIINVSLFSSTNVVCDPISVLIKSCFNWFRF